MKIENLKLLILDNDDVLFRSSPEIQFHVERNWSNLGAAKLMQRERTISIVQYQYDQMARIIAKARKRGVKPNLPDFSKMRNDVIKTENEQSEDFEEEYYRRPLDEVSQVLEMVKFDKEMFLEERDATIEADGKLEHGVIPYDEIYSEKNWIPYSKENVIELYNLFENKLISLTAHNGIDDMHGREFEAKGDAVHRMVSDIPHYGLRFHAWEHRDGERRPRNSKGEKIKQIYGLDDLRGVVLVDDSLANCIDIYNHGGTPILVSQNKENPYGFATVRSTKPESILRELDRTGYMSSDKTKILRKPESTKRR